jgi:hypothetical protein
MIDLKISIQLRPDSTVAAVVATVNDGQQFKVDLPREPSMKLPVVNPALIGRQPQVRHSRRGGLSMAPTPLVLM